MEDKRRETSVETFPSTYVREVHMQRNYVDVGR